jgi:hypothetical protein
MPTAAVHPAPSDTLRAAAPDLARQFGLVLGRLCTAIGLGGGRPLFTALLDLVWSRVNRTRHRLEHLLARLAAGWRPRPATPRAAPAAPPDPAAPRRTRVCAPALAPWPHGRGWLVHVGGYHAAGSASQLEHLLTDPAIAELVATVPSVGRMLRPLCRILGISPPVLGLKPPKPPRVPRARPESAAHPATTPAPWEGPLPEPPPDPYWGITRVLVR